MGSSCAYFLHSSGNFRGSIAVVEPDPSYREAASTRSASSIRQQFSTPLNIALSVFGLDFLRAAPRLLQHAGTATDLNFVESTYLYLATSEGRRALEERVSVQQLLGSAGALARSRSPCRALSVAPHRGSGSGLRYGGGRRLVRWPHPARGAARSESQGRVCAIFGTASSDSSCRAGASPRRDCRPLGGFLAGMR